MEFAGMCESQPVGNLSQGQLRVTQVVFRQVTAHSAEQPGVCLATLASAFAAASVPDNDLCTTR